MKLANYLYPYDLQVTPTPIRKILLIGSCLSELYKVRLSALAPGVQIDHILYNGVADLPDNPTLDISGYDIHYIQIPIRGVLGDGVVRATNFLDSDFARGIFENATRAIDLMLDAALRYSRPSGTLAFVSNFMVPQGHAAPSLSQSFSSVDLTSIIADLNRHLASAVRRFSDVFVMDVDSLANSLGKHHFLDDIIYMYTHGAPISPYWSDEDNWPAWTAPERGRIEPVPPIYVTYPDKADDFYEAVYRQMEMSYRIVRQIDQVKLVIFDLDNTMWRGQMAEHYAPGQSHPHSRNWPLGIWETIHHLRWRGILVAICSKNDLATVESRWNSAIDLPWLKLSDFISVKINWKTKVENISDILEETKLTPKSVVFVDDSPVERGSVTAAFPDIRTIGSDPFQTRRILLWSPETQVAKLTRESQNREEMVRQQIVREGERRSMSRQEFLAALECRVHIVDIRSSGQAEFARFMELINKTNQFNTTGKRWTAAETLQFLNGGGRIMVFFVQDKYAEYGLVGAVLVQGTRVVQFVMSCRVLGMEIESAVLSHVVRLIRDASAEPTSVSGRLVHTDSNGPCRQLFSNAGFAADPTDGEGYVLGPELPLAEAGHVSVSTDFQLQSHAADRLKGHVDQIDNNRISGWAANTNVPDVPVDVSLYVNEFRAVTVTCGRVRSDAVAAGYPGARQFFIDPKPHLKPGVNFLRVCFGSSGEALVRGLREITN